MFLGFINKYSTIFSLVKKSKLMLYIKIKNSYLKFELNTKHIELHDLIKSLLIKVKYIQYDVIQYILSH